MAIRQPFASNRNIEYRSTLADSNLEEWLIGLALRLLTSILLGERIGARRLRQERARLGAVPQRSDIPKRILSVVTASAKTQWRGMG